MFSEKDHSYLLLTSRRDQFDQLIPHAMLDWSATTYDGYAEGPSAWYQEILSSEKDLTWSSDAKIQSRPIIEIVPRRSNDSAWYTCNNKDQGSSNAPRPYYPVSVLPPVRLPIQSAMEKEQPSDISTGDSAAPSQSLVISPTQRPTQILPLGSPTPAVNGPAYNSNGNILNLAPATSTRDGALAKPAPKATEAAASSIAILTLGSAILTAIRSQETPSIAVIGSKSLSIGGQAFTTAGHTVSFDADGLVIDGTSTVPFTEGIEIAGALTVGASSKGASTHSSVQLEMSSDASIVRHGRWKLPPLLFACLISLLL
jgi:hypothetical protein